jgi:Na+-transporting methylmalonyl-CoA/oxaloacetate decarboxylase gamma subunit
MNTIWIALSISGVAMLMCLAILAVNIKIYTEIVKRADHERRYRESGTQCR